MASGYGNRRCACLLHEHICLVADLDRCERKEEGQDGARAGELRAPNRELHAHAQPEAADGDNIWEARHSGADMPISHVFYVGLSPRSSRSAPRKLEGACTQFPKENIELLSNNILSQLRKCCSTPYLNPISTRWDYRLKNEAERAGVFNAGRCLVDVMCCLPGVLSRLAPIQLCPRTIQLPPPCRTFLPSRIPRWSWSNTPQALTSRRASCTRCGRAWSACLCGWGWGWGCGVGGGVGGGGGGGGVGVQGAFPGTPYQAVCLPFPASSSRISGVGAPKQPMQRRVA
jgi:hypothetical protein